MDNCTLKASNRYRRTVDRDALDISQAVRIGYGKRAVGKLGIIVSMGTSRQTGFGHDISAITYVATALISRINGNGWNRVLLISIISLGFR